MIRSQSTTMIRSGVAEKLSLLAIAACIALNAGCNSFGSSKLAQQLQSDNERLLAELRAQRSSIEELKQSRQLAEARAAEAEKMLATLQPGYAPRLSALTEPSTPAFFPTGQPVGSLTPTAGNPQAASRQTSSPRAASNPATSELGSAADGGQLRWQRRTN